TMLHTLFPYPTPFRSRWNSPDIRRLFEFDSHVIQVAWIARNLYRAHLRPGRRDNFAERRFTDLQRDPRTHMAIVSRRISTTVKRSEEHTSELQSPDHL